MPVVGVKPQFAVVYHAVPELWADWRARSRDNSKLSDWLLHGWAPQHGICVHEHSMQLWTLLLVLLLVGWSHVGQLSGRWLAGRQHVTRRGIGGGIAWGVQELARASLWNYSEEVEWGTAGGPEMHLNYWVTDPKIYLLPQSSPHCTNERRAGELGDKDRSWHT